MITTDAPDDTTLREVALTREEYELAVARLGRRPSPVELGVIGALWSEHCGYKTSKPLLSRFPSTGERVLHGPGQNAGVVDVGDGIGCAFKIESHNHPSAIEPYQGAATGVGGIVRDVFAMGARPVALLDSLHFGPLTESRQRHLYDGVVAGIGGYGNCIGVATVGGELVFDEAYTDNCLVNAMCVGLVETDRLMQATARGPGNPVLLVGADTGRDGIHGATFASVELDDASIERRPAVQVGNPFMEKCLLEACLELSGDERVVALQDLGAAGLTSSAAEMAHRGGCGIALDVDRVPRRETGMSAYEVMLSESQERMLLVVRRGCEEEVIARFTTWGLRCDAVGEVLAEPSLIVTQAGEPVCDLPLAMLIDEVPLRHPAMAPPADREARLAAAPLDDTAGGDPQTALRLLLSSANGGSRRAVYRTYDHQVGNDTVVGPGGDAAVVRIHGTGRALALTTDSCARIAELDPRRGAAIAVCEAARNVVATGARPIGLTNCLNFANPERPEIFWQLSESVDGISAACRALGIPVVSGNVSLYNEREGRAILPTAVIGMVGLLDDASRALRAQFPGAGARVSVVGPRGGELGGSEYQRVCGHANTGARPRLDLAVERATQQLVLAAAGRGLISAAHDCAGGGLLVALAEMAVAAGLGCELVWPDAQPGELLAQLVGETQSRFVVCHTAAAQPELEQLCRSGGVEIRTLGECGGDRFELASQSGAPLVSAAVGELAGWREAGLR